MQPGRIHPQRYARLSGAFGVGCCGGSGGGGSDNMRVYGSLRIHKSSLLYWALFTVIHSCTVVVDCQCVLVVQ